MTALAFLRSQERSGLCAYISQCLLHPDIIVECISFKKILPGKLPNRKSIIDITKFITKLKIRDQSMDLAWSSTVSHTFLIALAFRPAILKSTLWPLLPVRIPLAPLI